MLQYKSNNVNNCGKTKQFVRTTAYVAADGQANTSTQCPVCPQKHIIYNINTEAGIEWRYITSTIDAHIDGVTSTASRCSNNVDRLHSHISVDSK